MGGGGAAAGGGGGGGAALAGAGAEALGGEAARPRRGIFFQNHFKTTVVKFVITTQLQRLRALRNVTLKKVSKAEIEG